MKKRSLGRTGLQVSAIALGGAPFGYVNRANDWDPFSAEGKKLAVKTVNHALDSGINYIDTAQAYGDGNSESIIGEVMKTRRGECVLASKVRFGFERQAVIDGVHASLKRLQTDYIDVMQIHGRMFSPADQDFVTRASGQLDVLRELREAGKIGHIGITADEAWTLIPFLDHNDISVYQIAYNIIYQGASRHFLIKAAEVNAGVVTMRTMTSGVFQSQISSLAPEWQSARDVYEVSLKFVLSDARVHAGIIGMRWPHEVDKNLEIIRNWVPPIDIANMPRLTIGIYQAEDAKHQGSK